MDEYDEIYGDYGGNVADAVAQQSQPQHAQPTSQQQEADPPGPPPGGPGEEDDADDSLVTLNEPEAKPAANADDEFEVQLDDTAAEGNGGPPSGAPPPQAGGFRYARPGVPPAPRPEGGPRPYMDATSSSAQPAAPWAGGGGRGMLDGGRGLGTRLWRPQFIPLSATALEKDDTLAFPEAAKPGQMIKLPGQTRVTPDEYHEFITLGQGGVYELDMDRVIDAPWKVPGTETSAFFNYSLTPAKWRAYVREIQQAHAELRMQGRIQLYDMPFSTARDPDMPPELIAALAGKGTTGSSHFGEPRPPSATQTMRQDAPDAILLLAGNVQ